MRKLAVWFVLGLASAVQAQETPASMPAVPPEVQKTVDAFVGTWTTTGTLSIPEAQAPLPVKMTIECKKTALGRAAMCNALGEATGLGPMEFGILVGFDAEEKLVHLMAMTSNGEIHDHKGAWKDDKTLAFEPLKYKTQGQDATEDLSFTFGSAKEMSFQSVITKADGSKETFEGKSTR